MIIYIDSLPLTANAFLEEEEEEAESQLNKYIDTYTSIVDKDNFRAMEYNHNRGTYILHHSTRNEGNKWQLSFIAGDGIPTSHSNFTDTKELVNSLSLPFYTEDRAITKVKILVN